MASSSNPFSSRAIPSWMMWAAFNGWTIRIKGARRLAKPYKLIKGAHVAVLLQGLKNRVLKRCHMSGVYEPFKQEMIRKGIS